MSTVHQPLEPAVPSEAILRLSVEQYHEMIRAGIRSRRWPTPAWKRDRTFKKQIYARARIAVY